MEKTRVDKWIWAIRLFKTRTAAGKACSAGKVKIEGKSVKASFLIKVGDDVSVQKKGGRVVVKVLKLIEKRVGASIAQQCYEDITPEEEKNKSNIDSVFYDFPHPKRERGSGRPTKKERRTIDRYFGDEDMEDS